MNNIRNQILWVIVVILISTVPSFAYYNPKTGRFLQRDPSGTGPIVVLGNNVIHVINIDGPTTSYLNTLTKSQSHFITNLIHINLIFSDDKTRIDIYDLMFRGRTY